MKSLKQIREEYDTKFGPWDLPEEVMLEDLSGSKRKELGDYSKKSKSLSNVPSVTSMPNLLMFRRITYRRYPDNQTVALYYSKSVDKYLSIPFGPTGNLNLSEATIYDTLEELDLNEGAKWEAVKGGLKGAAHGAVKGFFKGNAVAAEPGMAIGTVVGGVHGAYKGAKSAYQKAKAQEMEEDWQSVNRKDKTDGLSQAAVNAYRREHPGSKLKTAVTEKNPTGKRASRRKSFCSRMGGMKKRLTSAKTARDPNSRINKALRRWNCEEEFKMKLQEKREERLDEFLAPLVVGAGEALVGLGARALASGAARSAAPAVAKGISKLAGKFGKSATKTKIPKTPDASAMARSSKAPKKADASAMTRSSKKLDALDTAADITKKFAGGDDQKSSSQDDSVRRIYTGDLRKAQTKSYTPQVSHQDYSPVDISRKKTLMRRDYEASGKKQVTENKMSDLRKMISEGINTLDLSINGRTVTLNSGMVKRILEVYDSVNTKNKKIVESMLNEDLESFKKLLNFSIRN